MTDGPVMSVGHSPAGEWDLVFTSVPEVCAGPVEIVSPSRQPRPPVVFIAGCVPCENYGGQRVLTGVDRLADGTIEIAADRYTRTQALRLVAMVLSALNYEADENENPDKEGKTWT